MICYGADDDILRSGTLQKCWVSPIESENTRVERLHFSGGMCINIQIILWLINGIYHGIVYDWTRNIIYTIFIIRDLPQILKQYNINIYHCYFRDTLQFEYWDSALWRREWKGARCLLSYISNLCISHWLHPSIYTPTLRTNSPSRVHFYHICRIFRFIS